MLLQECCACGGTNAAINITDAGNRYRILRINKKLSIPIHYTHLYLPLKEWSNE